MIEKLKSLIYELAKTMVSKVNSRNRNFTTKFNRSYLHW